MFKLRYPMIALASAIFGAFAAIGLYAYYVPLPKDAMVRGEVLQDVDARSWLNGAMSEVFPTRTVEAAPEAEPLQKRDGLLADFTFSVDGEARTIEALYETQNMLGLVVLKDGVIAHESYAPGYGPGTLFTTWSVVKSITSTMVGVALEDGLIESVSDPLSKYLPEVRGTAYDGVTIEQTLQMASGVDFDRESMNDSVTFLTDAPITAERSAFDLALSFPRGAEPGTRFNYNTAETQLLLELIRRVSGKTAADYLSEALWQPLGMRYNAAWILDAPGEDGAEIGGAMFNATLRDWARFGWFMAQDGAWNGERLVQADWVAQATRSTEPHLMRGNVHPDPELGYAYQWWTRADGTFQASGAYGQLIYVDPANGLVIAKASAWPDARVGAFAEETTAMARALADWDFNVPGGEDSVPATTVISEDIPPNRETRAERSEPAAPAQPANSALAVPSVKPIQSPPADQPEPVQEPGDGMGVAESRFIDPDSE
ncbi:MAG: serine hydrolase [Pseudomonadota bacterium]